MCDEARCFKQEQMSLCVWYTVGLNTVERFLGFIDVFDEQDAEFLRLKRIRREPNRLNDFVLMTTTGAKEPNEVDNATAEDYFLVNAHFKVLDSIIVNLKKQFSTESLEVAESIDNFFKLNIEKSKFFINHYKDLLDINSYNLKSDITVVKNYSTLTTGKDDVSLENLKTCIIVNVYPNMYKLLQVALTLPRSSATCERSFSTMRQIKTWM
ncbi:hypothetical protein QTP88_015187 [Uroleucon formosanum]